MARLTPIRDDFRDGFHASLGKVVVASGRLEYEMQLAVKSLLGRGFTLGMAEAVKVGIAGFKGLCARARTLANNKLPEPHRTRFLRQVDAAIRLAEERNDHVHAAWTSGRWRTAHRIRPHLAKDDKGVKVVSWDRSHPVRIKELNRLAAKANRLQRQINKARRFSWPDNLLKEEKQ